MYVTLNLTHFLKELIRIMLIIGRNNCILLPAMKISLLIICEASLILSEYFNKMCVPLPVVRMMGADDICRTLQLNTV